MFRVGVTGSRHAVHQVHATAGTTDAATPAAHDATAAPTTAATHALAPRQAAAGAAARSAATAPPGASPAPTAAVTVARHDAPAALADAGAGAAAAAGPAPSPSPSPTPTPTPRQGDTPHEQASGDPSPQPGPTPTPNDPKPLPAETDRSATAIDRDAAGAGSTADRLRADQAANAHGTRRADYYATARFWADADGTIYRVIGYDRDTGVLSVERDDRPGKTTTVRPDRDIVANAADDRVRTSTRLQLAEDGTRSEDSTTTVYDWDANVAGTDTRHRETSGDGRFDDDSVTSRDGSGRELLTRTSQRARLEDGLTQSVDVTTDHAAGTRDETARIGTDTAWTTTDKHAKLGPDGQPTEQQTSVSDYRADASGGPAGDPHLTHRETVDERPFDEYGDGRQRTITTVEDWSDDPASSDMAERYRSTTSTTSIRLGPDDQPTEVTTETEALRQGMSGDVALDELVRTTTDWGDGETPIANLDPAIRPTVKVDSYQSINDPHGASNGGRPLVTQVEQHASGDLTDPANPAAGLHWGDIYYSFNRTIAPGTFALQYSNEEWSGFTIHADPTTRGVPVGDPFDQHVDKSGDLWTDIRTPVELGLAAAAFLAPPLGAPAAVIMGLNTINIAFTAVHAIEAGEAFAKDPNLGTGIGLAIPLIGMVVPMIGPLRGKLPFGETNLVTKAGGEVVAVDDALAGAGGTVASRATRAARSTEPMPVLTAEDELVLAARPRTWNQDYAERLLGDLDATDAEVASHIDLKHVFEGETMQWTRNGVESVEAEGLHLVKAPGEVAPGRAVYPKGTFDPVANPNMTWTGRVTIDGVTRETTMFPLSWSPRDVFDAIKLAIRDGSPADVVTIVRFKGIDVKVIRDQVTGAIVTAYPVKARALST